MTPEKMLVIIEELKKLIGMLFDKNLYKEYMLAERIYTKLLDYSNLPVKD